MAGGLSDAEKLKAAERAAARERKRIRQEAARQRRQAREEKIRQEWQAVSRLQRQARRESPSVALFVEHIPLELALFNQGRALCQPARKTGRLKQGWPMQVAQAVVSVHGKVAAGELDSRRDRPVELTAEAVSREVTMQWQAARLKALLKENSITGIAARRETVAELVRATKAPAASAPSVKPLTTAALKRQRRRAEEAQQPPPLRAATTSRRPQKTTAAMPPGTQLRRQIAGAIAYQTGGTLPDNAMSPGHGQLDRMIATVVGKVDRQVRVRNSWRGAPGVEMPREISALPQKLTITSVQRRLAIELQQTRHQLKKISPEALKPEKPVSAAVQAPVPDEPGQPNRRREKRLRKKQEQLRPVSTQTVLNRLGRSRKALAVALRQALPEVIGALKSERVGVLKDGVVKRLIDASASLQNLAASQLLTALKRRAPQRADVALAFAGVSRMIGDDRQAMRSYRIALADEATRPDALRGMAGLLVGQGRPGQAVAALGRYGARSLSPDMADFCDSVQAAYAAHSYRENPVGLKTARAFAALSGRASAPGLRRELTSQLDRESQTVTATEDAAAVLARAAEYARTGRGDETHTLLKALVTAQPGHTPANLALADHYLGRAAPKLAEKVLLEARKVLPGDLNLIEKLGDLYAGTGRRADAAREYRSVVERTPGNLDAALKLTRLSDTPAQLAYVQDKVNGHMADGTNAAALMLKGTWLVHSARLSGDPQHKRAGIELLRDVVRTTSGAKRAKAVDVLLAGAELFGEQLQAQSWLKSLARFKDDGPRNA